MARTFALTGLLRLRRIEQERAAADMATANAALRRHEESVASAQRAVDEAPVEAIDSRTLAALAASRAARRSMLSDLYALGPAHQDAADAAREVLTGARRATLGLEKLQERHQDTVAAEELTAEQLLLDEVASQAWHRSGVA